MTFLSAQGAVVRVVGISVTGGAVVDEGASATFVRCALSAPNATAVKSSGGLVLEDCLVHNAADGGSLGGSATAAWGASDRAGLKSAALVWDSEAVHYFMAAQHIERECHLALEVDERLQNEPDELGSRFREVVDTLFDLGDTSKKSFFAS